MNFVIFYLLLRIINIPRSVIRKETVWTLSNIVSGVDAHVQAVIDADIVQGLIHMGVTAGTRTRTKKMEVFDDNYFSFRKNPRSDRKFAGLWRMQSTLEQRHNKRIWQIKVVSNHFA